MIRHPPSAKGNARDRKRHDGGAFRLGFRYDEDVRKKEAGRKTSSTHSTEIPRGYASGAQGSSFAGKAGPHGIQGIGANFIPSLLDQGVLDQVMTIETADARAAAHDVSRTEGILVGISSGAALHAAVTLAALPENAGKTIVALLPDGGDRYLSTGVYD